MYLLKVNIALILFYAFYKLLLSRDTFFVWRRMTLLACIFISIVIPIVNISEWVQKQQTLNVVSAFYREVVLPEVVAGSPEKTQGVVVNVLALLYMLVAVSMMVRFLIQLSSVIRLRYKSEVQRIGETDICVLNTDIAPFSFFRWIFINPNSYKEGELAEIITHERTHAKQWHSIDVVIGEMACIVFWYNPFIWLIKQEIRNNLEYLADNNVLRKGYDTKTYQYHLLGLTYQKAAANLYNNFNVLPLKERIKMMNKKRTNETGRVKYILLLPMVAVLLLGSNMNIKAGVTSSNENKETMELQTSKKEVVMKAAEKMPKYPGGEKAMMDYLRNHITYPQKACEEKIEGCVIVRFVVQKDGSIGDIEFVRSVHPLLDEEAKRLVKGMPKFEPGTVGGEPVNVWYTMPIVFKLTSNNK